MNARAPLVAALAVASAVLGLATTQCAPQDVVVAELPASPDGGYHRDKPCVTDSDCPETRGYCARRACADVAGRCENRPVFCDDALAPSCGCDGITYWNDCLRRAAGVTAHTDGECVAGAATCGDPGGQACPVTGASCARLYPPQGRCDPDGPGTCWMLPPTCPAATGPYYERCGAQKTCSDACTAIRSEQPHHQIGAAVCP